MHDAIPFLRRQPVIILFGVVAWLLALKQLFLALAAKSSRRIIEYTCT
ncbi:MAG: hypothetical protein IPI79_03385 [Moraxellaceae bacterium]|nr:hypothetical protein [Moraxellaceae bacterium]MBK8327286.1 hypothetical protein [Moraxellaceae bacterium]